MSKSRNQVLEIAQQWITDNRIEYVLAQFVDIHGAAKTKDKVGRSARA